MKVSAPLRWLCACPGSDERFPTTVVEQIAAAPDFDWDRVLRLAHSGMVATQLYPEVCRRGCAPAAPQKWHDHLLAQYELNDHRLCLWSFNFYLPGRWAKIAGLF